MQKHSYATWEKMHDKALAKIAELTKENDKLKYELKKHELREKSK